MYSLLMSFLSQKLHGVDLNVSDAFRNIDPSYIPENVSFAPSSRKNGFSDQLWLTKCSVSIRKHPCYFPELIHEHRFIEIAYVFKGSCRQKIYFENQEPEQIDLKEGSDKMIYDYYIKEDNYEYIISI